MPLSELGLLIIRLIVQKARMFSVLISCLQSSCALIPNKIIPIISLRSDSFDANINAWDFRLFIYLSLLLHRIQHMYVYVYALYMPIFKNVEIYLKQEEKN